MQKLIIQSSFILLAGLLIVLFIDYNFNINENISSGLKVKPLGVIILTLIIFILIWSFKKLRLIQPEINIFRFTIFGTIIVFISEAFYHLARQLTFVELDIETRLKMYFSSLALMTLYGVIISFLISYQLKTRSSSKTVFFVIIILFCNYIIQKYLIDS